jgi:small subunit ribosomal protein S6
MNVECNQDVLKELELGFKFNDAVLRHLTVSMDKAIAEPSIMMKEEKAKQIVGKPAAAPEATEESASTAAAA